jgi:hypothetical protein
MNHSQTQRRSFCSSVLLLKFETKVTKGPSGGAAGPPEVRLATGGGVPGLRIGGAV